jgi:predicted ferric reductase
MAIVRKYQAVVKSFTENVPNVFTVTFSSTKPFIYNPGQFLHLALDEYDGVGQWPESRCFSMQSSPNQKTIKITFALVGNYTKRMAHELRIGKEVWLKLPYGDLFTQQHNKVNTVFIAGGTGITPFLSLFTNESFHEYTNPRIYLGFRSKEYNLYDEDINRSCNSSLFVKSFYENIDGIIDIQSIFNENGLNSDYFISGPPVMIKSFKNFLLSRGLEGEKIRTDEWE